MMTEVSSQKAFAVTEAYEINGVHTEIVLHKFPNRQLLIITQYERLNNIFTACNDVAVSGVATSQSFDIKHQFGMTTDEIECGIRFLLTNVQNPRLNKEMDVVVCLGLKEYNGSILKQIVSVLNQLGRSE